MITWNHTTVCRLFVLDTIVYIKITYYHITVDQKKNWSKNVQNCKYERTTDAIPSLIGIKEP